MRVRDTVAGRIAPPLLLINAECHDAICNVAGEASIRHTIMKRHKIRIIATINADKIATLLTHPANLTLRKCTKLGRFFRFKARIVVVDQPRQPVSRDLILDGFGAHCSKERRKGLAQFDVMGQDNGSVADLPVDARCILPAQRNADRFASPEGTAELIGA